MKSERTNWIDVARGIGILLVLYGHALGTTTIRALIYSFHMPLFFFLSGLVFKGSKGKPYLPFFKKDFKRIMIPYFIFAFISLILWIPLLVKTKLSYQLLIYQILGIFYGSGSNHLLTFNVVLWFLPCLFLTKQVFWFISKLPDKFILCAALIFSIIGYLFSIYFPEVKLPFGFEIMLTSIVFFGLGFLLNYLPERINQKLRKYALAFFTLFITLNIIFALISFNLYGHQIDLRKNELYNYFLFYISAICGILATLSVSMFINKNRVLEYLGQNTMILFVWHLLIFSYISRLLFHFITPQRVVELRDVFLAPIYTTISIAIILGFKELFRRSKIRIKLLI